MYMVVCAHVCVRVCVCECVCVCVCVVTTPPLLASLPHPLTCITYSTCNGRVILDGNHSNERS